MKVLNLVLTHKWYDMIASGTKKEEYREIKKFYLRRLCKRYYDAIRFHRGYTKTSMLVECRGIGTGIGNPDWGAPPDKPVFIIKLGKVIEKS